MENQFHFNVSESLRPISAWGYIGYHILFNIPIVGFILLIVFSLGGTKNINVRNFARSYLLLILISIVLVIILLSVAGISFAQLAELATYGY